MNKTVLITGSTCGIGEAFAELFASKKNNLFLVSRNKELLQNQKEYLKSKYSIDADVFVSDLSCADSSRSILEYLQSKNISIDILVNNAGLNKVGAFANTDLEKEVEMVNLHILTLTKLTKLLMPMLIENKGKILNLGSTGSYIPSPFDAVYSATKAYVLSFSKSLSYELKRYDIGVTCICPGATNTKFAEKSGINNSLLFTYFVMKPEKVANIGYKALMKNKPVKIIGSYNKILVAFSYILPDFILNPLNKFMMEQK